jgi:hypothetical protein
MVGAVAGDTPDQRDQSKYISIAEMAADLEASQRTIRSALAKGKLRGLYLGTRAGWRVTREDYAVWKRSLDNQQGRVDMTTSVSTPEQRYREVFGGKVFCCPTCGAQHVLPDEMESEQNPTLGLIHVIGCKNCAREYAICFGDRMQTVAVRAAGEPWSRERTRDLQWLLGAQQGW